MNKCKFCKETAIAYNSQGHMTCSRHKTSKTQIDDTCPVCSETLENKHGKYGSYYYCFGCNKNWNTYQIERFNEI